MKIWNSSFILDIFAKWRHPNPFRVTPPFTGGGTGHWEGNGKHWEQDGSGGISSYLVIPILN